MHERQTGIHWTTYQVEDFQAIVVRYASTRIGSIHGDFSGGWIGNPILIIQGENDTTETTGFYDVSYWEGGGGGYASPFLFFCASMFFVVETTVSALDCV